jgi:hypothetical protein
MLQEIQQLVEEKEEGDLVMKQRLFKVDQQQVLPILVVEEAEGRVEIAHLQTQMAAPAAPA